MIAVGRRRRDQRHAGEGIQYAIEKGVFVVTSTRTGSGRIAARRRGTAAAAAPSNDGDRARRGRAADRRIAAEDLAPVKARILLMLALDPHQQRRRNPADVHRVPKSRHFLHTIACERGEDIRYCG